MAYGNQNKDKELHIQEERRLFYVAYVLKTNCIFVPKKATSPFIKELSDELMNDISIDESSEEFFRDHSELKIKYEQQLQKALSRENYAEVKKICVILETIKLFESGLEVKLGEKRWEKILKKELTNSIKKSNIIKPEEIFLSASSIDTYEKCPLKYRLSNIDGIPQTANKPELVFGNIIIKFFNVFIAKQNIYNRKNFENFR